MKNQKGITLISLVIAIIVILILASISIYSGTSTVRYANYNKAKAEIQTIHAQVSKWHDEFLKDDSANNTENETDNVLDYGEKISESNQETKRAIEDTFSEIGVDDENLQANYRFFSEQYLKDTLGLDASFDYLVDIIHRDVILVGGVYYNGKSYFTLDDFGITNVDDYKTNSISFNLEPGNNKEIVISNVKLHLEDSTQNETITDISKFIVEYMNANDENNKWIDVTKNVVKFEDGEENNKTTKYKFSVDSFGEYEVRVRTTDKKLFEIGQVELYEKTLTEEATGIYVSTLDYTATSETDDSKILTIDGAMLLSAGSQAVPSRVQNDKFVWKSSNTNVATVTSDGVVKCGTEAGTAIITLIGSNKTKSLCKVKTTAKIAKQKQDSNYTINGEEGLDVNPTIPGGFYAIDTNITEVAANNIDWKLTGNQTNTGKGLVIMNDAGDQFVWVPVKKDEVVLDTTNHTAPSTSAVTVTSDLYTPMATTYTYNGNTYYRGMLYTFAGDTTSTTVKYNSGYNVGTTSYREPSLITGNNSDKWAPMTSVTGSTYDAQYFTNAGFTETQGVTGFGAKMQEDYDEMIRQVQAYGGFWVGRFESSWNDKIKKVASVAGTKSFTNADKSDRDEANMWYGLYRTHKAYSNNSSMIWGSQYDAMMNWMAKNGITVGTSTVMSGTVKNVGNNATNGQRITGNPKYNDKLSNVIDIYGNSYEWTLEAGITHNRVSRGGSYNLSSKPDDRSGYTAGRYRWGRCFSSLTLYKVGLRSDSDKISMEKVNDIFSFYNFK